MQRLGQEIGSDPEAGGEGKEGKESTDPAPGLDRKPFPLQRGTDENGEGETAETTHDGRMEPRGRVGREAGFAQAGEDEPEAQPETTEMEPCDLGGMDDRPRPPASEPEEADPACRERTEAGERRGPAAERQRRVSEEQERAQALEPPPERSDGLPVAAGETGSRGAGDSPAHDDQEEKDAIRREEKGAPVRFDDAALLQTESQFGHEQARGHQHEGRVRPSLCPAQEGGSGDGGEEQRKGQGEVAPPTAENARGACRQPGAEEGREEGAARVGHEEAGHRRTGEAEKHLVPVPDHGCAADRWQKAGAHADPRGHAQGGKTGAEWKEQTMSGKRRAQTPNSRCSRASLVLKWFTNQSRTRVASRSVESAYRPAACSSMMSRISSSNVSCSALCSAYSS